MEFSEYFLQNGNLFFVNRGTGEITDNRFIVKLWYVNGVDIEVHDASSFKWFGTL